MEEEDSAGSEVDDRVAQAFDSLNNAIAQNNEVEAKHAAAIRKVQAQEAVAQQTLAPLSKAHRKQIRKIEQFRHEQAAAHEAAARLKRLSLEHANACEVLQCAREALALQREGKEGAEVEAMREVQRLGEAEGVQRWKAQLATFAEAEQMLEARRAAAEKQVKRLVAERRRCAADAEGRAKRVVEKSAVLGDVAAE